MKAECVPDLFILGVPKAGTTFLARQLAIDPAFFLPELKEPHYFGKDLHWHERVDEAGYERLYANCPTEAKAIDASTHTCYSASALEDILALNPSAHFILVLRDPVERAFSHYRMHVTRGTQHQSFETCLEPAFKAGEAHAASDANLYAGMGFYAALVRRLQQAVSPNQYQVLLFEDLTGDPKTCLGKIYQGLQLTPPTELAIRSYDKVNRSTDVDEGNGLMALQDRNAPLRRALRRMLPQSLREKINQRFSGAYNRFPPLQDSTRQRLCALYKDDILETEILLGTSLAKWPSYPRDSGVLQ